MYIFYSMHACAISLESDTKNREALKTRGHLQQNMINTITNVTLNDPEGNKIFYYSCRILVIPYNVISSIKIITIKWDTGEEKWQLSQNPV